MNNNARTPNRNNSLRIQKSTFFEKIHIIFDSFFNAFSRHQKRSNNTKENGNVEIKREYSYNKEEFANKIKIEKKESKIEKLQQLFENDKTTIKKMSNREVYELNLLYEKQIEELKKKILLEKKKYDQLNS